MHFQLDYNGNQIVVANVTEKMKEVQLPTLSDGEEFEVTFSYVALRIASCAYLKQMYHNVGELGVRRLRCCVVSTGIRHRGRKTRKFRLKSGIEWITHFSQRLWRSTGCP